MNVCFTTCQVLSPLRNVVESLVPLVPSRSTPTVPEERFEAFKDVRLVPDNAGKVAGRQTTSTGSKAPIVRPKGQSRGR